MDFGQGPETSRSDGSKPTGEGGPGRPFAPGPLPTRGMHVQTPLFTEMSPSERAAGTDPLPLPLGPVPTIQAPLMDWEDLAGPPPLLQSSLSPGAGRSPASRAPGGVEVMSKLMAASPVAVRTEFPG